MALRRVPSGAAKAGGATGARMRAIPGAPSLRTNRREHTRAATRVGYGAGAYRNREARASVGPCGPIRRRLEIGQVGRLDRALNFHRGPNASTP